MYLEQISKANDVKKLPQEALPVLAEEIRGFLVDSISKTGGHLASNLGVVELSIALHRCLEFPQDKLIWDVGHQSYTHKILTGRKEGFAHLRAYGGMSGFPKRAESDCDVFDTGHSSTSISAGIGFAFARDLKGTDERIVSVIGDGSLTGGLAFEGINNASSLKKNFVVVLNDNSYSISKNVGGLSVQLSKLRTSGWYTDLKEGIHQSLKRIPYGRMIDETLHRTKGGIKQLMIKGMIFEELGLMYLGPVDGHDIAAMEHIFEEAFAFSGPVLVHVITKKGKGYPPAEKSPVRFHSTGSFDPSSGLGQEQKKPTYTQIFSAVMKQLGEDDDRLVGITAAMMDGTVLGRFARRFPQRFMDVGISEEHAVTVSAALALSGMKPVVCVYSSFLQRAFDEILHDVCLQKLPVVFAID
ncbi:MAG: 1-deoxy-D-xylulose-5-phosphate synthase, partial [Lachnospiraceae bacterium]|nr:1-deoxy-D-xylulose-5-phosphate synthase [Lachnospiraceae bacterium]